MAPADQRKAGKIRLPMVALGSFAVQDPIKKGRISAAADIACDKGQMPLD